MKPEISVIIPTLGQRGTLPAVLSALEKSPYAGKLEALIIDNSPDGALSIAEKNGFPGFARALWCKKPGAAAARNLGSREAKGEFLLFLDDDVVPLPGLIEEHLKCVKAGPGLLSMGRMLPAESVKASLFGEFLIFYGLLPGYENLAEGTELSCEHFNSSNFLIRKEDFFGTGGFDEGFDCYGWEDVEFGSRLPAKNLRVLFSGKALAEHRVESSLPAYQKKMKLMGRSAVKFAGLHPELSKRVNILNYDADKGLFRYNIKEIERLDLSDSEALKSCRDFAGSLEGKSAALAGIYNFGVVKEVLFECYALLLRHEYLAGFKEGLLSLSDTERKKLVSLLENQEVSKQSSLREEADELRKTVALAGSHPFRFFLSTMKSRLLRRKK